MWDIKRMVMYGSGKRTVSVLEQLGMTDLGAIATPNGASTTTRGGLTFLNVQPTDTPQVALSLGQEGSLVCVLRTTTWEASTQGIVALWRTLTGDSVDAAAGFLEIGDNSSQVRRTDDVGSNLLIQAGASYESPTILELTWDATNVTLVLDGAVNTAARAGTTYQATTTLTLGYDPSAGAREVDGECAWVHRDTALSGAESTLLEAELRRIAADDVINFETVYQGHPAGLSGSFNLTIPLGTVGVCIHAVQNNRTSTADRSFSLSLNGTSMAQLATATATLSPNGCAFGIVGVTSGAATLSWSRSDVGAGSSDGDIACVVYYLRRVDTTIGNWLGSAVIDTVATTTHQASVSATGPGVFLTMATHRDVPDQAAADAATMVGVRFKAEVGQFVGAGSDFNLSYSRSGYVPLYAAEVRNGGATFLNSTRGCVSTVWIPSV